MGSLKDLNVSELKTRYNLDTFVETGTGKGDGLEYVANSFSFKRLFSSEIVPDLFLHAQNRLLDKNEVLLFNLESEPFLKRILPLIEGNCLFWLDAHFPGSDYCQIPYDAVKNPRLRLPLEKELDLIFEARSGHKDVIICDDLRIYEEANYEAGNLKDLNLKHIGSFNLSFLSKFETRYKVEKSLKNEGYIFIYPL
jgi:hypothetical protein